MPIYKQTAVTAKQGTNFIRSTVEASGCLFIKIEQDNDLGIDALIEFLEGERPLNEQIAVQIKSGNSYYAEESSECSFQIGRHRDYWTQHPLPVFGFVYIPSRQRAHWVNIKTYLKTYPSATAVRFTATEANRLEPASFTALFMPTVLRKTPTLEIDEALALARSEKADESYLGLLVLFRRFPNSPVTWDELVRAFVDWNESDIPPILLYWLAHIPWHGDIASFGEQISSETRDHARRLFAGWRVDQVLKLLSFIDPEEQIGRGTLGQSIEAIISSLPKATSMLREIVQSPENEMQLREYAALIIAMNEGHEAKSALSLLESEGSSYAGHISRHLEEFGGINPYA